MDGPVLIGERVILRPIDLEKDVEPWFHAMQDSRLHEWTGNTVPEHSQETYELLERYKKIDIITAWSILWKESGQMIGTFWLSVPWEDERGISVSGDAQRLDVKWWGIGVVSESRELVYQYAFLEQNIDEIISEAWTENYRSCRSMERVGFNLVKIEDVFNPKYQRIMCQSTYRLTKEDWKKSGEKMELSS